MTKTLAIIAGEPNSISSEIIFKTWKRRKKFRHKPFFVIGNVDLLNKQKKKLKYKFQIKKINSALFKPKLNSSFLPVYDVKYNQKKTFEKISQKSNNYIFNCFQIAINLIKKNKIQGFVNCPISKENLLKKKYSGITEYLSRKFNSKEDGTMLIFNKILSVSPLTTHIPLKKVSGKINIKKIVKKILTIERFYNKKLKKKPIIGILGLNPHNYSSEKKTVEKTAIIPAIKILRGKKIKVIGPISPDTSFLTYKKNKINVILGMYHDQVLTPFKTLFKYNAVNVTLGLPFLRTSPDHGTAEDIVGKKIADPTSLIESIKFFNNINI